MDVPIAKIIVTIGIKTGVTMVNDSHSSKHTTLQQEETEYGLLDLLTFRCHNSDHAFMMDIQTSDVTMGIQWSPARAHPLIRHAHL